ncbi:MAG TPA: outer membrane beta-barrel protein [Polyangiaceae bacterium]|jgi:hypothetical protein|nr:outer membrane beta-barrel protein [Polyangiaceae bacterium]
MKTKSAFVPFALFNLTLLASAKAEAEENRPYVRDNSPAGTFGNQGQLVISSDAGLSISNTTISGADDSTTTIILRPAVDYFVADYFSIGGFVGLDHTSTGNYKSTAFSIGPRVGYDIPLSDRFSLWPKVGLSFANTSITNDNVGIAGGDAETSNTSVQLNLFVPFLFQPVNHFFLGFGPALDQDLSGDSKATIIAARLTLGGWM